MPKPSQHSPTAAHEEPQVRMTFGEHLEELRKRITHAILGSLAGIVLCIYFCEDIIRVLVRPYRLALMAHNMPDIFTYSKPAEAVILYLSVGFKAGLILCSPWIIYQVWLFIAAGLYQKERRIVYKYVAPSALLFFTGVAFLYFLVLPLTLSFFIGFTGGTAGAPPKPTPWEQWVYRFPETQAAATTTAAATAPATMPVYAELKDDPPPPAPGLYILYVKQGKLMLRTSTAIHVMPQAELGSLFINQPKLDEYINFVAFMALLFGCAFETPMVIVVLAQIGLVRTRTFKEVRKYAYFGIALLSAVAAPTTDVVTMLCLMVPMIALYELGVLVASILVKDDQDAITD